MHDASALRKGLKISIDNEPYEIVQFQFSKPGKGQALYKCKLKNMVTGAQFDKTYRSVDKIDKANFEETDMEYLYADGNNYCFMNTTTYEQDFLTENNIGDLKNFLKENIVCKVLFYNEKPIGISLPNFVEFKITKTEPWEKGNTASGSTKPATIETGYVLNVPPFIAEGEKIRIDTRSGDYVERVK